MVVTVALITALLAELDDAALNQLADALAPRIAARMCGADDYERWLNSTQAAEHLGCTRGRIHDLVQLGRLKPRRDGRRLLFRTADLDACLEGS